MKGARLFLGTVHLQNHKIVSDCVRKLAYDIRKRNLITPKVTIISEPYNKHVINRKIFCTLGPWLRVFISLWIAAFHVKSTQLMTDVPLRVGGWVGLYVCIQCMLLIWLGAFVSLAMAAFHSYSTQLGTVASAAGVLASLATRSLPGTLSGGGDAVDVAWQLFAAVFCISAVASLSAYVSPRHCCIVLSRSCCLLWSVSLSCDVMIFVVTVTAVVSSAHNILRFTFLYLSAFLKLLWGE